MKPSPRPVRPAPGPALAGPDRRWLTGPFRGEVLLTSGQRLLGALLATAVATPLAGAVAQHGYRPWR